MEIFVHRDPAGFETFDLEDINELEELLGGHEVTPLEDNTEVHVEITGKWSEIRGLLSNPVFKTIWFDPKRSPTAVEYYCDRCEASEWGHSDSLPKGWRNYHDDNGVLIRTVCPKCREK